MDFVTKIAPGTVEELIEWTKQAVDYVDSARKCELSDSPGYNYWFGKFMAFGDMLVMLHILKEKQDARNQQSAQE